VDRRLNLLSLTFGISQGRLDSGKVTASEEAVVGTAKLRTRPAELNMG